MTTYIVINTIAFLMLSLTSVYFYYTLKIRIPNTDAVAKNDDLSYLSILDWKVKGLLILSFILILVSFISPFLFTREAITEEFDFRVTGQIGDTIGGLMNPFIALAGAIVTGLAFYIQFEANQQQRKLFLIEQARNKEQFQEQINLQNKQVQLQQFESQFYEMLKLHRENISEMKIDGYDFEEVDGRLRRYEKTTVGRKIFVVMQTELECILQYFVKDNKLDKAEFHKCYELFFSGLEKYEKKYPSEGAFIGFLKMARQRHQHPEDFEIFTNNERKRYSSDGELNFNYKPFSGHAQRLGHYFRHLFLTVKSVANSTIITDYEDKMRYLRILRAQLSNHEQIMLFYNWLGQHGGDWENDSNAFFTEYCMIHNLWYDNLLDNNFISDRINYLRTKNVNQRKGSMFEMD